MKSQQDIRIENNCNKCEIRSIGFFCRLTDDDIRRFEALKVTKVYPKGAMLFVEGQPSDGIYMLCQGKVKLSTCSPEGKAIILEIAEPGDLLGLSAALNNIDHETTAKVLEISQVNYVSTTDLVRFLEAHPQASLNAARQLSRNYQTAYRQVCSLGLSDSVADKLARLFLDWSRNGDGNGSDGEIRLKNSHTHEAIAEMIGTTRETVTRALKYFRESKLVTLKGSDLVIHDRQKLVSVIGGGRVNSDM